MTSLLKNKTKTLRYIILLFIVSALGACDKQTVYHAFQSIPQEGWKRQDTLLFNVAVPDSQTYYKLIVEIRNRSTYPYQNINLSVCYDSPELKKLQTDTLTAVLADKEGIWKGDGWGGLYQSAFPAGNIKIGKPGGYDLVSGWKQKRYDPLSKTIPTKLFNATARKVSDRKSVG